MLISNGDGTYTAAALDVLLILHDMEAGTYHAAFFEEAPPPGPVQEIADVRVVRLRSKMHHTTGATSLEGAQVHLDELAAKILVMPENLWREKPPYPWNGDQGITLIVENWRRDKEDTHAAG